jgi:glutathione S-transferase
MTMILWGRRNSSNVQKVLWALEELGLSYERRRVGGSFGGTDDPAYRAMNPNGLVPTLQDGGLTLWESDAILRHLARTRGAGALRPDDHAAQALADQWLTWSATTLFPALSPLFFGVIRKPRAEQDVSALGPAAAKLATTLAILDARLARVPYVAGETFSFGDIGPAITARRALLLPWGAPDAPNVAAWLERLRARRAFQTAVEFPIGTCQEEWAENERLYG